MAHTGSADVVATDHDILLHEGSTRDEGITGNTAREREAEL